MAFLLGGQLAKLLQFFLSPDGGSRLAKMKEPFNHGYRQKATTLSVRRETNKQGATKHEKTFCELLKAS